MGSENLRLSTDHNRRRHKEVIQSVVIWTWRSGEDEFHDADIHWSWVS